MGIDDKWEDVWLIVAGNTWVVAWCLPYAGCGGRGNRCLGDRDVHPLKLVCIAVEYRSQFLECQCVAPGWLG